MTTYIGNPPKSVYGVKDATNVILDVVSDGTWSTYDIPIPLVDRTRFVYDIRLEGESGGGAIPAIALYQNNDYTSANYLTHYLQSVAGSNPAGGADSANYFARNSTGGLYAFDGTVSLNEGNYRHTSRGQQHQIGGMGDNWYQCVYNNTSVSSISSLRLSAASTVPAGIRILVTSRQATNLILPLEYSAPRKNYIINPDFKVNQRAFAGGTVAAGTYTFDRWKNYGASVTLPDADGFVTISGGSNGDFQQILEEDTFPEGTQVTVSWEGTVQASDYNSEGDAWQNFRTSPFTFNTVVGTVVADSLAVIGFTTGTLKNLKLELGPIATPFDYPDPASELTKCQRYFIRIDTPTFSYAQPFSGAIRTGNGNADCMLHAPVSMRVQPDLTFSGDWLVRALDGSGSGTAATAVVDFGGSAGTARLWGNAVHGEFTNPNNIPAGTYVTIMKTDTTDGYIDIYAEL